jgi:RNase P/RNase MRP subunit POP5
MLRRAKHRYLSLMHSSQESNAVNAIVTRCSELFGSIAAEKAAIRLVRSLGNIVIIKCALDQVDDVLFAIALIDPPMVTLGMSASMRRLRR